MVGKIFQMKATDASIDKRRGGYYTPNEIARFLALWVSGAGDSVLEPSCGDGQVLRELASLVSHSHGVELISTEAEKAREYSSVDSANFFTWLGKDQVGKWDGVAGNPPFIRFGNWDESERTPALNLMKECGLKPSKLINAWVPFVVGSALACRVGGRVGLVLPAELMQVTYAGQLRSFVLESFSEITLVAFEKLVFEGILQEVILFCGIRGKGPAKIRVVSVNDARDLEHLSLRGPAAPALLHDQEKWTKYFLPPQQIEILRDFCASPKLPNLGTQASVDVGIVTGCNSFFTMTSDEVSNLGLSDFVVPLVSRSAQLTGLVYDDECRNRDLDSSHRTWLLNAPEEIKSFPELQSHIRAGEADGVHKGYKCSIRNPWWKTPSYWVPDAFMLRQIHLTPRVTVNNALATSTDTVHRIRMHNSDNPMKFAVAFHNSVTFAFTEVMGRSYGGGVLELEPREAERLPMPSLELVDDELIAKVERALNADDVIGALDLVDQAVLIDQLGFDPNLIREARESWLKLQQRRTKRRCKAFNSESDVIENLGRDAAA